MPTKRRIGWALPAAILLGSLALPAQHAAAQVAADSVVPIDPALCRDMKLRHVLNPGAPVGCERLRLLRFAYVGLDGQLHGDGEMVAMDAAADHLAGIFAALRARRFPIARARLMNEYGGDDDASMAQNNTSAFNVRPVAGSSTISVHAYGLAVDLNPIQNPFIERVGGRRVVSPPAGADYLDRRNMRPGMAEAVVDVFADHGFTIWGGNWRSPVDYQHFQVGRGLAGRLARASRREARALFEREVERYRRCLEAAGGSSASRRRSCATAHQ